MGACDRDVPDDGPPLMPDQLHTQQSDTSPFTTQSSRDVTSRTNPGLRDMGSRRVTRIVLGAATDGILATVSAVLGWEWARDRIRHTGSWRSLRRVCCS